jgi:hypothetical protein
MRVAGVGRPGSGAAGLGNELIELEARVHAVRYSVETPARRAVALARTHGKLAEVSAQAAPTCAGKLDKGAKASAQIAPTTAKANAWTAKKTD